MATFVDWCCVRDQMRAWEILLEAAGCKSSRRTAAALADAQILPNDLPQLNWHELPLNVAIKFGVYVRLKAIESAWAVQHSQRN
jgi:hypothetical protein